MRVAKCSLVVALLPAVLAGCGVRHFEYRSAGEIPEGPGMLSGEDGAFVLYSDRAGADRAGAASPPAELSEEDRREFREFQAFQRWKAAKRDTPEYREFREWQEWKAYRAWKQHAK